MLTTVARPGVAFGALLRVVAAAFCWGLNAVFAKAAFDRGVPPARLAEARVAVALLSLAPLLAWWRPDLPRVPRGVLPVLVAFGACVAGVVLAQAATARRNATADESRPDHPQDG